MANCTPASNEGTGSTTVPVKQVLFDLGGVLVTLDPQQRVDCFLEICGIGVDQVNAFLDSDLPPRFSTGKLDGEEFYREAKIFFNGDLRKSDLRNCWNRLIADAIPANLEAARRLSHADYQVGLLSNTDPWHWEYISSHILISDELQPVFTSFELGLEKPERRLFRIVSEALACLPDEILLIDDSRQNLETARSCGWQVCQYESVPQLHSLVAGMIAQQQKYDVN
ncbi:MAG: HAD family phosphatase [Candidatus Delongbacteria bacterium]|nr:HAD family phosphatase [Candidatus Delongbacteria bacterium]